MRRYNWYDVLIVLIIATVAWGNYEAFRFLYPIRIIGFFGLFVTANNWSLIRSNYKKWSSLLLIWLLFVVLSAIWTPNDETGFAQAIHIATLFGDMGLLMYLSIVAKQPQKSLITGWVMMVLITLPIAFWEITTGQHLASGSFSEDAMLAGEQRILAAVTFGNPNSYVVVLSFALPFVLGGLLLEGTKRNFRLLLILLSISIAGIVMINASRGCVICLLLGVVLFIILQPRRRSSWIQIPIILAVIAIIINLALTNSRIDFFGAITYRFENEDLTVGRMYIYREAFNAAKHTYFLGGGVGSTVYMMMQYAITHIKVTHNCYLEILIEYGLIISVAFWWLFYKSSIRLWKSKNNSAKFIGYYIAISSVFLFSVDDYYTGESAFWIYTASLIVLSYLCDPRKTNALE